MLALSLYLPTLAPDLTRLQRRLDASGAVLLSRADHQREVVAACCAVALHAGVAPGMTVAHARALLPVARTHIEPYDAGLALRALRRLAVRALRLAPRVALDPPDGLLLDATGCGRLYRSAGALAERLHRDVRGLGLAARVAGAPTFGAAWALARFGGRELTAVGPGRSSAALRELTVACLRLDTHVQESLLLVGIDRVGHLADLPRQSVAARFGPGVLLRLDQAFGRAPEAITTVRTRKPVRAEQRFDGPTDRLDSVELSVRALVGQVAVQLKARMRGCRALEVRLDRPNLPPSRLSIRTARPTRDAAHLWKLLRPGLERADLGFGVDGVVVTARALAPLPHEQRTRWSEGPNPAGAEEVSRLADTLAARLGLGRVLGACAVESHLPERSFVHKPRVSESSPARRLAAVTSADRPSVLHDRPLPADAVMLVPDGPVASLRVRGEIRRVLASIGPETIEAEWWRGGAQARDYFKIQTDDGRWLWVFRERPSARWFIHGEWA